MDKYGKTNGMMIFLGIAVVSVLAMLGFLLYQNTQQQQFGGGGIGDNETDSGLSGRSATIYVTVRDTSNNDPSQRVTTPLYLLTPGGNWEYSGGTSSSTTTSTALTNGISIGSSPYKITAFNATYQSVNGLQDIVVDEQSPSVDVDVYTTSNTLEVTLYDKDDNALSRVQANISLTANEESYFKRLVVKNNRSQSGFNMYGFYFDMDASTNISYIKVGDDQSGKVTKEESGDMPLESVTTDDLTWKLTSPELLYEFDEVSIGSLIVKAKGNDPVQEPYTLTVVDSAYYFSSDDKGVLSGPENDANTPADVGSANIALAGRFN